MWTLLVLVLSCSTPYAQTPQEARTPPVEPPSQAALLEDERNSINVFDAAAPATVFVTQKKHVQNYYTRQVVEVESGSGTGFLWDRSGHVVTNFHVLAGGRSYEVTLYNKQTYEATVVGVDKDHDIAVLKLVNPPEEALRPIRLPPEDRPLRVGQKTIAIGNPFGFDHTLTTGIVSALDREIQGFGELTIKGMIQTDASINPGNSGGPLLNSRGELIGMNTMIYSGSGTSAGVGFAVPIHTIRRIVPQLIQSGHVTRVGIGVTLFDDQVAQRARISGVIIREVMPGSPADKAGLIGLQTSGRTFLPGDVIVAIEERTVNRYDDLYTVLDGKKPGEFVNLTVSRDGQRRDVKIQLYELPAE